MTAPTKLNFKLYQGSTFAEVIRWESATKVYKPITGAAKAAPLVLTAVAHGLPTGWRFLVSGVSGMKELNTDSYLVATTTTVDTVTVNAVNASGYTAYTSGGILEYNQPVDLQGMTARMQIREKLTSTTVLETLTTENSGIVLDNTAKTITLKIPAETSAAYTFPSAVYSLEILAGGTVTQLAYGSITLVKEITR